MDRTRVRYTSDDPTPVSLPANYDPRPAVVTPGDVVEVNAEAAEIMLREEDGEQVDPRWQRVDDDTPVAGSYAGMNRTELARIANRRGIVPSRYRTNADLAAALDAADLVNPIPPGNAHADDGPVEPVPDVETPTDDATAGDTTTSADASAGDTSGEGAGA